MDQPNEHGGPASENHLARPPSSDRARLGSPTGDLLDTLALPTERLARRMRAAARLLRSDMAFGARIAAHVAVLGVALIALLASRMPSVLASEPQSSPLATLAQRVGQSARDLAPAPVLSTDSASYSGWGAQSEMPGFISTGAIAEADPSLLPWDEPQRYVVLAGDTVSVPKRKRSG